METDRRIIDQVCCYLTLPKARERRGAEEKGEHLPTLVFLVEVVSLVLRDFFKRDRKGEKKGEQ